MKMLRAGHVNNWDLVDVSAPIIGDFLINQSDHIELLEKLARSKNLWQRRTAMVFTFAFLRKGITGPTVIIAESLLEDDHDLIHKATGWMLREMGKVDPRLLRSFLSENAPEMPRTALRYSIERLPESERKRWLAIKPSRQNDRRSLPLSKRR
jgi:3-methyladenine DNA glycosylase AlkD